MRVEMVGDNCSRCGAKADLHPFHLQNPIKFRGKWISYPWLCGKCYVKEKAKSWAGYYLKGEVPEPVSVLEGKP